MRRSHAGLSTAAALPLLSGLALLFQPAAALADSAAAFCVFSRHDHTAAIEQGPCRWSQRQGNVTIRFRDWLFDFPAREEGRSYTRQNREGPEAGPVFNREGQYTLSVYWQKPAREPAGW